MQNKIIYIFFFYFSQISNVESSSVEFHNSEIVNRVMEKYKVINI